MCFGNGEGDEAKGSAVSFEMRVANCMIVLDQERDEEKERSESMATVDLDKYPRAACSKHGGEAPHTGDVQTSRCIDCGKAVVKEAGPRSVGDSRRRGLGSAPILQHSPAD